MPRSLQIRDYDLKVNYTVIDNGPAAQNLKYDYSNLLKAWLRFVPDEQPLNDTLSKNQDAHYRGELEFSDELFQNELGKRRRKSVKPLNQQSYVVIDQSVLNINDGSEDKTFTFSTWIRIDQGATSGTIFCKQQEDVIDNIKQFEFFVNVNTQTISLIFYDRNVSLNTPKIISNNYDFSEALDGSWHHVMVCFDPSKESNQKIFFYLDGNSKALLPGSVDDGYVMMRDFDVPYVLGMSYSVLLNFDTPEDPEAVITPFGLSPTGFSYAETALWEASFDQEDARTVFKSTSSKIRIEESGFLSESPRLQIRNLDHATGSYPGNSSHGMPDFNGRYDVNFNDTKALNFTSNYAQASVEFNPFDSNDPTNPIRSNNLKNISFEFKLFDGFDFIQKEFSYFTQPSQLNASNIDQIAVDATESINAEDLLLSLSKSINESKIGIEARIFGLKLLLRYHKPGIGSFQQGSRIESKGDLFDVVKEIKQFRIDGDKLKWPAMVPEASRYSNANSVTPHRLDGIEAPGRMVIGVSDSHVRFTPGQEIKPFNEYRVPNVDSDPFYALGTEASVLPNFSAKLSSKNSVVIDLSHGEGESAVYFSTGSDPLTGLKDFERNSGIAYYDFSSKAWQPKGLNEELEFYSSDVSVATGSMLSIIPSTFWGTFPNLENVPLNLDNIRHIGKPQSFAGFPQASKFDASKNQLIKMKDHIKGPFLVEKVELEVNGVLGAYPPYNSRLNRQKVQDLIYTNVSGTNLLGRNVQIYYESIASIEPVVELTIESNDYVITIKFRSGITTAQQIIDAVENAVDSSILQVGLDPSGNSSNPQVVEEIYEFIPE
jgi:hypothetical protein